MLDTIQLQLYIIRRKLGPNISKYTRFFRKFIIKILVEYLNFKCWQYINFSQS